MTYEEETKEHGLVNEPDLAGYYDASDYLKWKFDGFVELIRGKIFKMSSPATAHQIVSANLSLAILNHFKLHPCKAFIAPYDVYLVEDGEDYKHARNIVQPDICVICDRNKIKRLGCVGAPDLIIEILSPSTARKDLDYKFSLYEEFGVEEYWIVHPVEGSVIMNVLENGRYKTLRARAKGELLNSVLFPELTVDLEAVFDDIEFED